MSQGKEHIDKLIQEKLRAAEVAPPASAWDSIESSLNKKQGRAAIVLYRWLGYAAAILFLGFLAVYFIRSERSIEPVENKLAQKVIIDSITNLNDTPSVKKLDEEIQEAKSVISPESNIATMAVVEKEIIPQIQKQQAFIALQNVLEISPVARKNSSLIALSRLNQGELSSLYKSSFNALSLLKANAYQRMLENEAAFVLLAENSLKPERSGWSVGLAFAPTSVERSTGIFTQRTEAYYDMANSEMSFVSEKDLPAYSGGVNLVYQLSERWSFQSGVYYLKQGQRIENFSVLQNSANASNSSNSYFGNIAFDNYTLLEETGQLNDFVQLSDAISYSSYDADLLQRFELIEIPLIANYKIINRKTIFSIMAGLSPGFLVGNSVYLEDYSSERIGKTETVNTLIYKSILGLNIEYPLSRRLYFNFSPTFKYQLNNFNKNALVSEQLKYFEFKTGLNYRF